MNESKGNLVPSSGLKTLPSFSVEEAHISDFEVDVHERQQTESQGTAVLSFGKKGKGMTARLKRTSQLTKDSMWKEERLEGRPLDDKSVRLITRNSSVYSL